MSRGKVLARVVAVLMFVALAAGARGEAPLTTADLVRFLRAGISERTVLMELVERGFGEPLNAAREASLREAGASETLIVAVRRTAPVPGRVVAPAGARPETQATPLPVPEVRRGPTFDAVARSVRVPVTVLDKSGQPVLGLRGEDFQVSEDGRPQPVTFFSGERKPLRIALALDVSGSMANKMSEVADALRHFIDLLEPEDEIMVITFSGDVHVEQDFTSDRDMLERVFNRLRPAQGTALYDAALEAIERVAPGPAESKAVVLVSDGMDTMSQASFADLREAARRSEVPIFSIGIGGDALRSFLRVPGVGVPRRRPSGWPGAWPGGGGGSGRLPRPAGGEDFDARPLQELADDTGGRIAIVMGGRSDQKDVRLKDAVESIAVTLRHRYLVGYEPEAGKRGWRKIKVEVERPSVRVQARKGYYTEG